MGKEGDILKRLKNKEHWEWLLRTRHYVRQFLHVDPLSKCLFHFLCELENRYLSVRSHSLADKQETAKE